MPWCHYGYGSWLKQTHHWNDMPSSTLPQFWRCFYFVPSIYEWYAVDRQVVRFFEQVKWVIPPPTGTTMSMFLTLHVFSFFNGNNLSGEFQFWFHTLPCPFSLSFLIISSVPGRSKNWPKNRRGHVGICHGCVVPAIAVYHIIIFYIILLFTLLFFDVYNIILNP